MRQKVTVVDSDPGQLATKAVNLFIKVLQDLLKNHKTVVISIPGGRSVRPFFKRIARLFEQNGTVVDWEKIHFFLTDERLVSPEDPRSNYKQAKALFLDELIEKAPLPPSNVHGISGETTDPYEEVQKYTAELRKTSNCLIHLPVLGVGEDGHIGSLFPHHSLLDEKGKEYKIVTDSPKPPARRITVSPSLVKNSLAPFLFFIGEAKKDAYAGFLDEEAGYCNFPCKLALLGPGHLTCYVITDIQDLVI